MSRFMKTALVSFGLAAICWLVLVAFNPSNFEFVLAIAAFTFSVICLCFLAISISQKVCLTVSPYRLFAIVDGLIGICVLLYAIYDIMTSTGWFAGLLGTLLLIFIMPVILALLLADFLIWKWKMRKKEKQYKQ